jgi:hypothetical protein
MGSSLPGTGVGRAMPLGPLAKLVRRAQGFRSAGPTLGGPGRFRPRHPPLAGCLAAALALPLIGCGHAPLRLDHPGDPALVPIRAAFERTLAEARSDPAVSWQSGWVGNASINLFGGTRRGLCYEWRNLVFDGVIDTVRSVGWDATGVVISKGTYSEHSAVIVYDPKRISPHELLSAGPGTPVYVLDAWRRGEADIYPMHTWLKLPIIVRSPAQIKPLPVPPVSPRRRDA